MQELVPGGKEKIYKVAIDSVSPNHWNPNVMPGNVFNELAKDIDAEGMDQPVVVIPVETARVEHEYPPEIKWVIVDGEHRFRAHKAAGAAFILISVKFWNLADAKVHTIRRNLHGETDSGKFTQLVTGLASSGMSHAEMRQRMVMSDKTFAKLYQGNTEAKAKVAKEIIDGADKGTSQTFLIANLSQMIRDLVKDYGDTLHQGFICFSFKGQTHLMVSMDAPLYKAVQMFVAACQEDKLSQEKISKLLTAAISKAL